MSHWRRLQYSLIGTLANGVQAVIFTQVFQDTIMPMATGDFSGQFTSHIHGIETFWLAEIVILQFAIILYLLYGPVREQQRRQPVVRR